MPDIDYKVPQLWELSANDERVKALIGRVKEDNITPENFCRELRKIGVNCGDAMFYLHHVFGIRLDVAKGIVIKVEYGSSKRWAKYMIQEIDSIKDKLD